MNLFKHAKKLHIVFITIYALLFIIFIPILKQIIDIELVIKNNDLSTIYNYSVLFCVIFIATLIYSIFLHLKLKNNLLSTPHKTFIVLTSINALILVTFTMFVSYRTIFLGDEWSALFIIFLWPVMLLLWVLSLINGTIAFRKLKIL